MSLYGFNPTPTPAWATTRAPVIPSLNFGAPTGLASLPGASGGILARGLPSAGLAARTIPTGTTLASQVPVGVGRAAAADALALGGGRAAGGLAARLPSAAGAAGVASRLAPFSAKAAGIGGLAGSLGSALIDRTNIGGQNSNIEQALQGAALGAGLGAGFGPAGALIGGLGGGALGVLGNVLGFGGGGGEDDAPDPIEILSNGISAAGLSPDQTEEVLETYEVMTALAEMQPEGDARDAAMQQAFDAASAMILQAMQQKELASGIGGGVNQLALQQQAADIFEPLAQSTQDSARMYAAALGGIEGLPPEYRAIAENTAARELSSADRLANAYRAQAAVMPAINQLTQYQRDYNALAAQMFQQAQAQSLQGAGGGATTDISQYLVPQ